MIILAILGITIFFSLASASVSLFFLFRVRREQKEQAEFMVRYYRSKVERWRSS